MDTLPPHAQDGNTASETTFIYRLRDPETQKIRYVGKANDPQYRLHRHVIDRHRSKSKKNSWIISLVNKNLQPILEIIEEVSLDCWQERECFWIAFYFSQGEALVNGTIGGDGSKGMKLSEEARRKRSESQMGRKMPPRTEEWKRKQSEAQKKAVRPPCSEETKRKIGEANSARAKTEETRAKKRAAKLGFRFSEETKRNMSETRKGKPKLHPRSEEHRQKLSEASKKQWSSEEQRHKLLEGKKRKLEVKDD